MTAGHMHPFHTIIEPFRIKSVEALKFTTRGERAAALTRADKGAMMFETESQKGEIRRWSRLATQLNGAADTGNYDHITTAVMLRQLREGDVFDFLARELPEEVWNISQLTDVDRHKLSQHWRIFATAYEPQQFHVRKSGLALLVAYILNLIDILHVTPPR